MFGYVVPEKPELKIREYELFRAYYCGVCKSIGRRLGQIPRLTLTYDAAFLALFLSCAAGVTPVVKSQRCIAHPLKKRNMAAGNDIIDYASDINILLAYYKMEDNWKDDRSYLAAAGRLLLKPGYRKLLRKHRKKCDIIENRLKELSLLEKEKCASMDKAAEPFAKLMEEIMAYEPLCGDEGTGRILRWTGYNLGKWIYILDAFNDIEDNIKKGAYNSLIYQFGYKGEDINKFKQGIRDRVEFNLTYSLSQITGAYELIENSKRSGVVENIIYLGMLRRTEQILGTGSCKGIEKSI